MCSQGARRSDDKYSRHGTSAGRTVAALENRDLGSLGRELWWPRCRREHAV